jgi:hypothetical protein
MTTLPQAAPAQPRRPNARTFEGRQRQRVHALKRTLGYSESEYRTMLYGITGSRYARYLDEAECDTVIAFMRGALSERARIVARVVEPVSDDDALAVLG